MKLLIVIVNYHGAALTIDCLRSLKAELTAIPNSQVGLCENGSGDEEVARLRQAIEVLAMRDRVSLTAIYPNRGFTGGNNAVIRPALAGSNPPEAVLLLNNDTIMQPGGIRALVNFMTGHPEVGVCGSRLEYPDGESQRAARRVLTAASEFESRARFGPISRLLRRWVIAPPDQQVPHICGWVPGAALMIRREVLETVGLLDEDLYTYFDDVDYCLRAKRAGWPTWFVPESRIVHLVGKTTGVTDNSARPRRLPAYYFRARRLYFLKNFGAVYTALADLAAIAGLSIWKIRTLLERRPDPDPPRLLWDMILNSVFITGFHRRPVMSPPPVHSG